MSGNKNQKQSRDSTTKLKKKSTPIKETTERISRSKRQFGETEEDKKILEATIASLEEKQNKKKKKKSNKKKKMSAMESGNVATSNVPTGGTERVTGAATGTGAATSTGGSIKVTNLAPAMTLEQLNNMILSNVTAAVTAATQGLKEELTSIKVELKEAKASVETAEQKMAKPCEITFSLLDTNKNGEMYKGMKNTDKPAYANTDQINGKSNPERGALLKMFKEAHSDGTFDLYVQNQDIHESRWAQVYGKVQNAKKADGSYRFPGISYAYLDKQFRDFRANKRKRSGIVKVTQKRVRGCVGESAESIARRQANLKKSKMEQRIVIDMEESDENEDESTAMEDVKEEKVSTNKKGKKGKKSTPKIEESEDDEKGGENDESGTGLEEDVHSDEEDNEVEDEGAAEKADWKIDKKLEAEINDCEAQKLYQLDRARFDRYNRYVEDMPADRYEELALAGHPDLQGFRTQKQMDKDVETFAAGGEDPIGIERFEYCFPGRRNFICEIKHDGIRYATVEILCMWPASSWSTWNTSTVQLQPDMAIVKNFKSCPSAQKGKKPNWSNFTVADAGSQEKNCKNFAQITKLQSTRPTIEFIVNTGDLMLGALDKRINSRGKLRCTVGRVKGEEFTIDNNSSIPGLSTPQTQVASTSSLASISSPSKPAKAASKSKKSNK